MLRCQLVWMPSFSDMGRPRCRWGRILSIIHRKPPPARKPTTAGSQGGVRLPSIMAMAGASKDQKLAAIITPAANPSIITSALRLTCLWKSTPAAPRAVSPQVNRVASKAWRIGLKLEKVSIKFFSV
jgi:hypothetical protein